MDHIRVKVSLTLNLKLNIAVHHCLIAMGFISCSKILFMTEQEVKGEDHVDRPRESKSNTNTQNAYSCPSMQYMNCCASLPCD